MADQWDQFADAPGGSSAPDPWGEFQDAGGIKVNPASGRPSPWAKPEAGTWGKGIAVFGDEPTPFQGLKPDIEQGYMALARDPKSTGADLVAFGKANGFEVPQDAADKFIQARNGGRQVAAGPQYLTPPRPLIDPGDGATGAFARGVADPINMLDELGGVIDTVGGTPGRPNIWNQPGQRFGDLLWQNIDTNRSILGYDEAKHRLVTPRSQDRRYSPLARPICRSGEIGRTARQADARSAHGAPELERASGWHSPAARQAGLRGEPEPGENPDADQQS